MKIAIIGLPNAGKSTLLNSMVGKEISKTGFYAYTTENPINVKINLFSEKSLLYFKR